MLRFPFRLFLRKLTSTSFSHFSHPLASYSFSTSNKDSPKPDLNPKESSKLKENSKNDKTQKDPEIQTEQEKASETEAGKKAETIQEKSKQEESKPNLREKLKNSSPKISKCIEYGIYAWNLTFPKERYRDKFEKVKQKSREQKKQEQIILTEDDLLKMQEAIPEWKRNALIFKEEQAARESYRQKMQSQVKNKFNQTKLAKEMYQSDSYKEFETFKKEMHQFKEDLKDHIENSPNPVIQTSLGIYSKVSNESTVARAIKEMRNIDPTFDLYELEDDAKGIFEAAYTAYLQADLELLEKMCGEMALGYFKVLLRKMEAEKCEPKYKYLWQIDAATFSTALIPEKRLPVFVFLIKTQEIHCNISKIDKTIVDGDDERLMNYEYSFAITPHQSPDLENVGHGWEIIELQPRQVIKMLV